MNQLIKREQEITPHTTPLYPQTKEEIVSWARKYGLINSYADKDPEAVPHGAGIGRHQKEILDALIAGEPLSEKLTYFIKRVEEVVALILQGGISDTMKTVMIEAIITDHNPWMLDDPMRNMIKRINCEETMPGEYVEITHVDYVDEYCKVGGYQSYARSNNPKDVYDVCVSLGEFTELEKKIIAYALDRKPHRKNYALMSRDPSSIKEVRINREKGRIRFVSGDHVFDAFAMMHFIIDIFRELDHEKIYEITKLPIEEKKKYLEQSDWYKNFQPDFLQTTDT